MTRSSRTGELQFDPEIEKTARRLRKETKQKRTRAALDVDLTVGGESIFKETEAKMATNNRRSIKELNAPNSDQQPLCITFTEAEDNFELKSGLIHLLPSFHGLAGGDPHKHLKEFHVVCARMKPHGIIDEQLYLRAFPFSLKDKAKDWLYYLPSGSIETWADMKQQFLQRFFPASRATHLRKEIYGISQSNGESLYEYWERFKVLVASYPHHQFTESLLIQYFYKGLSGMDRHMVDAASGGSLIDKTPKEAQHLISTMAKNYRQYGYHTKRGVSMVNEISTNDLADKLSELTIFVHQMAAGQRQEVTVCGICSNLGHPTDACPLQQEGTMPNVNAVGGFPGQPQRRYDPHSNFYNPRWRAHPNFSYKNHDEQSKPHPKIFNRPNPAPQTPSQAPTSGMSLEDIVKSLAVTTQETRASLQHLGNQMSQLATSVSQLAAQASGKLPSQTEANPRENVSAMTLRSGKELQPTEPILTKGKGEEEIHDDTVPHTDKVDSNFVPPPSSNTCALSFPYRMSKSKEDEHAREILDTFKKVEINILLLDTIKQIPKYAKFLKELCTNKRKLKDKERIIFGKNILAVINRKLP
ncbi:UNVERIFIED_CONTAM: hypothetical protein Sradi_3165000 [Sesamum radiatum]|uniref:Retrotransposon gag domain-containing protein n=1 Tax=Sesamum radiatum TaxID=300843 RepID=A0AAW2RFA3_SESRA